MGASRSIANAAFFALLATTPAVAEEYPPISITCPSEDGHLVVASIYPEHRDFDRVTIDYLNNKPSRVTLEAADHHLGFEMVFTGPSDHPNSKKIIKGMARYILACQQGGDTLQAVRAEVLSNRKQYRIPD